MLSHNTVAAILVWLSECDVDFCTLYSLHYICCSFGAAVVSLKEFYFNLSVVNFFPDCRNNMHIVGEKKEEDAHEFLL